ncbi:MAG: aldo/keto reductase [Deltaproteobacteria bacterium]|nr:aldo/keto reductase [Deltaproteobacteria bacterium]
MELRRLGASEIQVTPIGLGCWQFAKGQGVGGWFWGVLDQDTTDAIVQASLDAGVNWFDTAEAYGDGASEASLASALRTAGKKDGDVVVATKWRPNMRTAGSIGRTIDDRLHYLDGFSIDLHQVHNPVGILSTHSQQMDGMADLVRAGKIRTVGISNFTERQMRRCHGVLASRELPLVSNQVHYSLLHRNIEGNGTLEAAKELGITIIAYSPLAQGLLTGKYHDDPARIRTRPGPRRWMPGFHRKGLRKSAPVIAELRRVAASHGATPAQVALQWLVRFHGDVVVAIPGASKVSHAQSNATCLDFELSDEELHLLDVVSKPLSGLS